MHWDYDQYYDQPDRFIEAIAIKMKVEARIREKEHLRSESRAK